MRTRKTPILGFAASCLVLSALAVDTRDYSTYIALLDSVTLANTVGGWPGADHWNDNGNPMSEEKYYLIPSGLQIASQTIASGPSGGTWPAAELAIQGNLSISATAGRAKCPTIPHLALCPGGRGWMLRSSASFFAAS